mmetsp:Transcript_22710/g.53946  ORF Transcript_22710/g.53946 Transcript_22710/m.53946 type:complete len:233 (-) Transcript_22710:402-1100(-)
MLTARHRCRATRPRPTTSSSRRAATCVPSSASGGTDPQAGATRLAVACRCRWVRAWACVPSGRTTRTMSGSTAPASCAPLRSRWRARPTRARTPSLSRPCPRCSTRRGTRARSTLPRRPMARRCPTSFSHPRTWRWTAPTPRCSTVTEASRSPSPPHTRAALVPRGLRAEASRPSPTSAAAASSAPRGTRPPRRSCATRPTRTSRPSPRTSSPRGSPPRRCSRAAAALTAAC